MKIGDSVRLAMLEWQRNELEASMLHACNAVDGTAAKVKPAATGSNARFTGLLRDKYWILGPMGAPGIDLAETRFPVTVERPKASGGRSDIADVIYGIHRCGHGHGASLPDGFDLFPDASGSEQSTQMLVERGRVRLSDRIIFGMLAVAVLSPANVGETVPDGFDLTYNGSERLPINEWWGREADFRAILARGPVLTQVKLDFGDWMDATSRNP